MARKTTTVYGRRKSLFQRMAALTVTASLVLSTFAGAAVLAVEPEQPLQAYPAASDTAAFLDTEGHWAEDQVLEPTRNCQRGRRTALCPKSAADQGGVFRHFGPGVGRRGNGRPQWIPGCRSHCMVRKGPVPCGDAWPDHWR